MKILQIIGISLISFSLIAGGLIFFAKTTEADEFVLPYAYEITEQSASVKLSPEQPGLLVVSVLNTGSIAWPIQDLSLHSIHFNGTDKRSSLFATSTWGENGTQVLTHPTNTKTEIRPREIFTFYIPIQAPLKPALYQENFHVYIGKDIVAGEDIKWLFQVGNTIEQQSATSDKEIKIWLDTQQLWAVENGIVLMAVPISTGKKGYNTPKGSYKILNHIETAYSSPYRLWMDNWMAISSTKYGFVGYGLHALPYWEVAQGNRVEGEIKDGRLYTEGKLYEDYEHLGKPMSHGCIRLGIETSQILYNWAPNGTPVTIA
ncbi:L,D-transpeptidase [Patescibacteria group bacterium]|nr:L,D-transpeptidase [Patescibacteria group bacterium]